VDWVNIPKGVDWDGGFIVRRSDLGFKKGSRGAGKSRTEKKRLGLEFDRERRFTDRSILHDYVPRPREKEESTEFNRIWMLGIMQSCLVHKEQELQ